MKKVIAAMLAVLMIITCSFSGIVIANEVDEKTKITVSSGNGIPGETVNITVGLENLPDNTGAVQLMMTYDQNVMTLINVDTTSSILTGSVLDPTMSSFPYGLGWGDGMSKINSSNSGTIAVLQFKILDNAVIGSTTDVTITYKEIYEADMDMTEAQMDSASVTGTVKIDAPVHDHTYGDWVIETEPTCTSEGLRKRTCSICGYVDEEQLPMLEHKLGEWVITLEPTCEDSGEKEQSCELCQAVINTEIIPAKGHVPKDVIITEPTCTQEGEKQVVCEICNTLISEETIPVKEHTAGAIIVIKEPTCTEDGKEEQRCTVCDQIIYEKILSAKGHSYGEWTVTKEATILAPGEQQRECSVCHEIDIQEIPQIIHGEAEHVFDGAEEIVKEPTCTETGIKKVYCSTELCTAYTEKEIPAKGHVPGEWEVSKAADCTHEGEEVKKCTVCHEVIERRSIPALGHSYDEWKETKAPTCELAGERSHTCTRCNFTETQPIDALGHTEGEWQIVKAATCKEAGVQEKYCTVCNKLIAEQQIDKLPHSFGDWSVVTEAACTNKGERKAICVNCGEEVREDIPMLEHEAGAFEIIKPATCIGTGEKQSKCIHCGSVIETVDIPALGHNYGDVEVLKSATCTESGLERRVCTLCGNEVVNTVSALGHAYGEPVVVKEATFNENGMAQRTCEQCNDVLEIVLPKLSESHTHDFSGQSETVKEATCTEKGEVHIHCTESECDAYKIVETAPKGHSFGAWTETKAATVDAEGVQERVCSVCKAVETQTIPKLIEVHTHDFSGQSETVKEATCTEKGEVHIHCVEAECDAYKIVETAPKGHSFGEWTETKAATTDAEGVQERVCSVCKAVETQTIPKLSEVHTHDFSGQSETVKEATCTEKGEVHIHCAEAECDAYKIVETAPKGHSFGAWTETKAATVDAEGVQERVCSVCKVVETQSIPKLNIVQSTENIVPQNNDVQKAIVNSPQTGDTTAVQFMMIMLAVSAVVIVMMIIVEISNKNKKRKKNTL